MSVVVNNNGTLSPPYSAQASAYRTGLFPLAQQPGGGHKAGFQLCGQAWHVSRHNHHRGEAWRRADPLGHRIRRHHSVDSPGLCGSQRPYVLHQFPPNGSHQQCVGPGLRRSTLARLRGTVSGRFSGAGLSGRWRLARGGDHWRRIVPQRLGAVGTSIADVAHALLRAASRLSQRLLTAARFL